MATSELKYLQFTFVNNILKKVDDIYLFKLGEDDKCKEDCCYCLDILEMSLLSLVLRDASQYPDGTFYKFQETIRIRVIDDGPNLFELIKCNDIELKSFSHQGIYFDNARKSQGEKERNLKLEVNAIDYLATALYVLNVDAHNESIPKSRECDHLLIDMSMLNPRLLLIVSYNMLYGILLDLDDNIKTGNYSSISKYISVLKYAVARMDSISTNEQRHIIIEKYEKLFKKNRYNMKKLSEQFADYFYGMNFEKSQTEEINVLRHLDYFCSIFERFCQYLLTLGIEEGQEIFRTYSKLLREIMDLNLTMHPKYFQAQYQTNEIKQMNNCSDLKKGITDYCSKNHLFIVGLANSLQDIDIKSKNTNDKHIDVHNRNKGRSWGKIRGIFRKRGKKSKNKNKR